LALHRSHHTTGTTGTTGTHCNHWDPLGDEIKQN
jgi:hypothetical protein